MRRFWAILAGAGLLMGGLAGVARGDDDNTVGQSVPLPYALRDQSGMSWEVQPDGSFVDSSRQILDVGARLMIDNDEFRFGMMGKGTLLTAQNQLKVGPGAFRGLNVTRWVEVDSKDGFVRYAEVFENPGAAAVKVGLRMFFGVSGAVAAITPVMDKENKEQNGIAVDEGNGNTLLLMGAGNGGKVKPKFNCMPNNDIAEMDYDLDVGAHTTAVVVHVEGRHASMAEAVKWAGDTKEKDYFRNLPAELLGKVVNFEAAALLGEDLNVLRGDSLDVVEVKGGDQYRGTILDESFKVKTFFGEVDLPAGKVAAMVNVGDYRPRQLVVTKDGEVYGGLLDAGEVKMKLSNGDVTALPMSEVTRLGYRKDEGESDKESDQPMVLMRDGERLLVEAPADGVDFATRYGVLKLKPETIASLSLMDEGQGVDRVKLVDGSSLTGLVVGDVLKMKLAGEGKAIGVVGFETADVGRVTLSAKVSEAAEEDAVVTLAGTDALVGTLTGGMKLDTSVATVALDGGQIRNLSRVTGGSGDVKVTTWDGSTMTGRLEEDGLHCALKCGLMVSAPAELVAGYVNPRPAAPAEVLEIINKAVGDFESDDPKVREAAEKRLIELGTVVIIPLKKIDPVSAEAQARIEHVVSTLEEQDRKDRGLDAPAGDDGGANQPMINPMGFMRRG